jgi:hypothetical protein
MVLARRLYVYLICGVSLAVLGVGLVNLLDLGIAQFWSVVSGSTIIGRDSDFVRREVSLYTALVAVSLPIWLLHWFLAERSARSHQTGSDRFSGIRALFLSLVLLVSFLFLVLNGIQLAQLGFRRLFGASDPFIPSVEVPRILATLLVVGAIWAYHARTRLRDTSDGALRGPAVWTARFYLYIGAFAGAMIVLFAIAEILRIAHDLIFDTGDVIAGGRWWATALGETLGALVVGAVAWGVHWSYSLRLLHSEGWQGESERRAALRHVYLYLLILVGVVATLIGATASLTVVARELFGVADATGDAFVLRVLRPLLVMLPFIGAWIVHRRVVVQEAARFADAPRQASVRRFYLYLVAFVGLGLTAVGAAYLLGLALDLVFGATDVLDTGRDWAPRQASEFLAITIVGAGAWLWHWYRIQHQRAASPAEERGATTRRVYLYLILAATMIAVLVSLAIVLYELFQLILGVGSLETLAADISRTTGIVIVAGAVLAYHAMILRRDLAERPGASAGPVEAEPITAAPAPLQPVTLTLVLSGPAGAELGPVLANLRARLPDGFELAVDGPPEEPTPSVKGGTASTGVASKSAPITGMPEGEHAPATSETTEPVVAPASEPASPDDGDLERRHGRIHT